MKYELVLARAADGALWLKTRGGGRARKVCTAAEACRRMRRSRRQIYRQIRSGRLESLGKVLGEWLLDDAAVERLAQSPLGVQRLPERLRGLFPEYRLADLNAGRDRVLVISRVFAGGGREAIRWLFRRYGRGDLSRFVREDGARLLPPGSARLWSLVLGVRPRPLPEWRRTGPWRA